MVVGYQEQRVYLSGHELSQVDCQDFRGGAGEY